MGKHINKELIKRGLKKCTHCKQIKSITKFSKNKAQRYGSQKECKSCRVKLNRERRRRNPQSHRDEVKRWKKDNPEKLKKQQERWRTNNPHKVKAQYLAHYHVPLGPCCEECGSTERLERHHPDYDKSLEIITLCKSCHINLGKNEGYL